MLLCFYYQLGTSYGNAQQRLLRNWRNYYQIYFCTRATEICVFLYLLVDTPGISIKPLIFLLLFFLHAVSYVQQ